MSAPPPAVPLCVDCAFHSQDGQHHMCKWRINPVTGGPGGFADLERMYVINGSCGPNGKNFERRMATPFENIASMFGAHRVIGK